jgi:hypothetical protein
MGLGDADCRGSYEKGQKPDPEFHSVVHPPCVAKQDAGKLDGASWAVAPPDELTHATV